MHAYVSKTVIQIDYEKRHKSALKLSRVSSLAKVIEIHRRK